MPEHAHPEHRQSEPQHVDAGAPSNASHSAQEANRKAGAAAVARITNAGGQDVGDPEKLAARSISSADFSVTDKDGEVIYSDSKMKVSIPAGTRLSVALDPGGLSIRADPGFDLDITGPNLRVTTVRYSFYSGKFESFGKASFDVFGGWASHVRGKLEKALETRFKPLFPTVMQRPGYQPGYDPDLQSTVQALAKLFQMEGDAGAALGGASQRKDLVDPSAFAQVLVPEDLHIPLGSESLEVFLKKGTSISVSASATGQLGKAKLDLLTVSSHSPGIQIRSTEKGLLASFKGLTMNRIAIQPGGRFSFDYDLDAEQMADGFKALVALLGIAEGHDPGPLQKTKLEAARKELDARLQREVPPRFRELLARFDKALPGFSLMDIFGVS